jgi:hypothetical protein
MASPEMRRAALAGSPNRKANFSDAQNSKTTEAEQPETALAAAFLEAARRKAVAE